MKTPALGNITEKKGYYHRYIQGMKKYRDNRLLTIGETARELDIPESWLTQEIKKGRLPGIRIDRQIRVNPEAIQNELVFRASISSIDGSPIIPSVNNLE